MRTDKAKNIKALKNELLKDPLQTEDQLAEKLWVNRKTINRLKEEMPEIVQTAKNNYIFDVTEKDKEIIWLAQDITHSELWKVQKQLDDWDRRLTIKDIKTISEISKESTTRYTIFKWDVSDDEWGLKNITSIEIL